MRRRHDAGAPVSASASARRFTAMFSPPQGSREARCDYSAHTATMAMRGVGTAAEERWSGMIFHDMHRAPLSLQDIQAARPRGGEKAPTITNVKHCRRRRPSMPHAMMRCLAIIARYVQKRRVVTLSASYLHAGVDMLRHNATPRACLLLLLLLL